MPVEAFLRHALLLAGVTATLGLPGRKACGQDPLKGSAPFRMDARFRTPIDILMGYAGIKSLASSIGHATGTTLLCAPRYEREGVIQSLKTHPAVDVATILEKLTGAAWVKVNESWILTDAPQLAPLALLSQRESFDLLARHSESLKSLEPNQRMKLSTQQVLLPSDLTPVQRQALRGIAECAYVRHRDTTSEALQLEGAYLRLERASGDYPNEPEHELSVVIPTRDARVTRRYYSMPVRDLKLAPGVKTGPGSPSVVPVTRPSRLQREPQSPPERRLKFTDADLQRKSSLSRHTVREALQALAENHELGLAVKSRLVDRELAFKAKQLTAATMMQAVEEATGSAWEKMGNAYVLLPHFEVEALADLHPYRRSQWLKWAGEDVLSRAGITQREALFQGRALTPERLTKEQRRSLKWIALLAFAGYPEVKREALDLKGVTVSAVRDAEDPKRGWEVQFRVPTRTASSWVVARLPYR